MEGESINTAMELFDDDNHGIYLNTLNDDLGREESRNTSLYSDPTLV